MKRGQVIGYTVLSLYGDEWAPDLEDLVDRKAAERYAEDQATVNYTPRLSVVAKVVATKVLASPGREGSGQ